VTYPSPHAENALKVYPGLDDVPCDDHHLATETHDDELDEEQADGDYAEEEEQSNDEEQPQRVLCRPNFVESTLPPDHTRPSRSWESTPAMTTGSSASPYMSDILLPVELGTPTPQPITRGHGNGSGSCWSCAC
jgi:hypothetical protein